jgi:glycosyltransferase involved in cell wall biosynthesis
MKQNEGSMARKIRLAYLVTHPIQYQAPLLRRISEEPSIDLTVFFCSDVSVKKFAAPGFGEVIEWDVPLLDGYRHEFLPAMGGTDRVSFWRPFNYGLARRLKEGRFDVLWVHGYARWFHWVAMVTAKRLGVKVLMRDEATQISTRRGLTKRIAKRLFFLGLKMVCDGFLVIGALNRDYYYQFGVEEEKIFLVPYAVDNAFFQARADISAVTREELRTAFGLEREKPVILYAGKMTNRKRASTLLEAYVRLSPDGRTEPNPYLLYIGDGEMRGVLEKRASELGWNSIKFLGFKNQTDLPRYYSLCDVFVLPSVREPWGLTVNEAMNAGRAVIVSDQAGCSPDLVKNGENGYVFKVGNVDDLYNALHKVLGNPDQCRAMGQKSLEIINKWGFEEDVVGLKKAIDYIMGQNVYSRKSDSYQFGAEGPSPDSFTESQDREKYLAQKSSLHSRGRTLSSNRGR